MYFLIFVIWINPSCGTYVSSLQGILVETIFRFLFWKYWEFQMSQNFWAKNEIDLDRHYIVLSLLKSRSSRSSKTFFKIGGERSCRNLNVSIATFIVTELSLSSKSWKDDDLLLYIILNALSCIRFVLCRSVHPKVFLGKGVLKICNKIYWRTLIPRCDFSKVALQLYWNHTSAGLFSCKFAAYFENRTGQLGRCFNIFAPTMEHLRGI